MRERNVAHLSAIATLGRRRQMRITLLWPPGILLIRKSVSIRFTVNVRIEQRLAGNIEIPSISRKTLVILKFKAFPAISGNNGDTQWGQGPPR